MAICQYQGYDLQLTRYDERGRRATFYTTGMEHSPTSATGTGMGAHAVARDAAGRMGRRWAAMDDVTPVVTALKKSGFPLQTRVEYEIRERRASGWKVLASEHPWRSRDGDDEFIDLIANCGTVVLVVECKKAQERSLLFLRPVGHETTGKVRTCTVWHIEPNRGAGLPFGSAIKDIDLGPDSYRAAFCVTTDTSSQRLLEQDACPVVFAADVLDERFLEKHQLGRSSFLPVIVTTAALYTLRYEPTEISLETGSYDKLDPNEIEQIPWVRFHKTLTAQPSRVARTVFVVNAAALPNFLDEISRAQGLGPAVAT
jgi:hypothetical protein